MRLLKNERKVVEYFNKKKYYETGFLKYNFWYNRIKFLLGSTITKYEIRKIFSSLLKKKYFNFKKLKTRSYQYEFINKRKQKNTDEVFEGITIYFE